MFALVRIGIVGALPYGVYTVKVIFGVFCTNFIAHTLSGVINAIVSSNLLHIVLVCGCYGALAILITFTFILLPIL